MTVIPHTELDPDVLKALLEEFVTRDGAVQGHHDRTVDERAASLLKQLQSGRVAIIFDEDSETCTIVPSENLPNGSKH
jgi:uncharacterized protein YheU (UPF0270 family)